MHSGTTATTAVAFFVTSVALGTSSRRVLLLLVLFSLSRVTTVGVGDGMLEVRLAAVHPRLVHANFELAGSGDRCAAAAVVVLVEGVEVVAVIVLGTTGGFDQRVDHNNQED